MKSFLSAVCLIPALYAEHTAPVFRTETRVVTVDVMIRDLKTRLPIGDLSLENFKLRIDGKDRQVSYFGHGGEDRRPLAMLVFFNLAPEGGLRELANRAAMSSFAAALQQLSPQDEVAVYAARDWFVGEAKEIIALTRDRNAAAQAMQRSVELAIGTSETDRQSERLSKEKMMSAAVQRAVELSDIRPDSQVALVYVSDGMNTLDTMEAKDRRALAETLQARNISFSALNLNMLSSYAAAASVINPLGMVFGLSVTGASTYLAKQVGGVSVEVPSAGQLGAALEQVVSCYASRYLLGYQVSESEYRDGRRHRIEVKLEGTKGKRLEVSWRKGFLASRD
ncbi:MAG: hypothetical protein H7039_17735 [Bryobacteraceae bacterium]|nr:hypothetical protein [Bryobacteraceae bacterium]